MGRWLLLVVVVGVGCIDAGLVPCGERACSAGSTCVGGTLCASPDQLAACDGAADAASCSVRGGVGRCDRGVCVVVGCGNGVVDPGEACDDLNTTSGDGCRGDCMKIEACGDAVIDDGEACDDGNLNPADACDACRRTVWQATALIRGGLVATDVGLSPRALATDGAGNVYVGDLTNYYVRRIDPAGVITTVAGTGAFGGAGDGGPATSAQISAPFGVAVDGLGNLYIADTSNSRIRRVNPTGIITTVAGTGVPGYNGEGTATSAQLLAPSGIAVDGLGTLYIADLGNRRIRRVDLDGTITTIAGTGAYGYGGDGGPATSAILSTPINLVVDGTGAVIFADSQAQRVRRIDPMTGFITTIAGTGAQGYNGDGVAAISAQLDLPFAVALDAQGRVLVADGSNARVRRIDAAGIISTIAGTGTAGFAGDGGAATSAQLALPAGLALDRAGNLFIADGGNGVVRRVDGAGVITTVGGLGNTFTAAGDGGAATSAPLNRPSDVVADGVGGFYVADFQGNRIRHVDASGIIATIAGTGTPGFAGDGAAATAAWLHSPAAVAIDGAGQLYIADTNNHRIRKIDANGVITTIAGSAMSGFAGDGGAATSAKLLTPNGVAVDAAGNVYIADTGNFRVRRIAAATGMINTIAGTGTSGFSGDNGAATAAQLVDPERVAVAQGNVYIGDTTGNRVRRIDMAGTITTFAGDGATGVVVDGVAATAAHVATPRGITVDAAGNVYLASAADHRVRRVDTGHLITTIAGDGTGLTTGDGGPASASGIVSPFGVSIDGAGRIFIADSSPFVIRRIDSAGVITTVAGAIDPPGMGPIGLARLADPRAFVVAPEFTLFAGGTSGTLQAARSNGRVEVVAGRYTQLTNTGALARFRTTYFGDVRGVAYDAAAGRIYITETPAHQIHVITIVDPTDAATWTIAPLANATGVAGFADGAAAGARFRTPTGLYLDAAMHQLYVADTGNHVVRAIDLPSGIVRTVGGTPATLGYFGDGGAATAALLFAPEAIVTCPTGDLYVADTGNQRIRRITAGGTITTVLGDGVAASSGDGRPARDFPVDAPRGLACDSLGNLFVASTTTVRLLAADADGIVDGTGSVQTIYGGPPRNTFPAEVTRCLTGLVAVDGTAVQVTDSCTGVLVEPGAS